MVAVSCKFNSANTENVSDSKTITLLETDFDTTKIYKDVMNLEKLVLIKTGLTELTDLNLPNLLIFEVSNETEFKMIQPTNFRKLKSLESLTIKHTKLHVIEDKSFEELEDLIRLDLSYNKLAVFPSSPFKNNKKLAFLDLSFNKIEKFDENIFSGLEALEILHLQGNFLTELPLNLFQSTINLKEIDLEKNILNLLEVGHFSELKELNSLNLIGNPCTGKHYKSAEELSTLQEDFPVCVENRKTVIKIIIIMFVVVLIGDLILIVLAVWCCCKQKKEKENCDKIEYPFDGLNGDLPDHDGSDCNCGKPGNKCGNSDNILDHMYDGYIDEEYDINVKAEVESM